MLGYLCVLLIVKAVVVLLSWDVRLPLCIVDGQSCSNTALGDVRLPFCIVDGQSCSSTALVGCQVTFVYC